MFRIGLSAHTAGHNYLNHSPVFPVAFAWIRGQLPIQMFTKLRPAVSVTLVDVVTQRIGVVELFVTRCTRVVMEADVLAHAGRALKLCIAMGA